MWKSITHVDLDSGPRDGRRHTVRDWLVVVVFVVVVILVVTVVVVVVVVSL